MPQDTNKDGILRAIQNRPYLTVPAITILGALGGKFLASRGAGMVADMVTPSSLGADARARIRREAVNNPRISTAGTVLGGLLGAVLGAGAYYDPEHPRESLISSSYWEKHPERLGRIRDNWQLFKDSVSGFGRTAMGEKGWLSKNHSLWGSELSEDTVPSVPVARSVNLVHRDPYLSSTQKRRTNHLLVNSDKFDGLASREALMDSAVKAGIDFIPAYAFGRGVGAVLGLPDELVSQISTKGGLARALYKSGIFHD